MKIQIPDDFDPEKSYGADNVSVPPHSPTVPSISSRGKARCLYPRLERIPGKRTAPLYAWKRVWAPYFDLSVSYKSFRRSIPAKDHFLRAAAGYGKGIRILRQDPLKCSSPLLSPKGNPFPLYGVPWKNFVLPQERKLQKWADFLHISLPVSAREIICQ